MKKIKISLINDRPIPLYVTLLINLIIIVFFINFKFFFNAILYRKLNKELVQFGRECNTLITC